MCYRSPVGVPAIRESFLGVSPVSLLLAKCLSVSAAGEAFVMRAATCVRAWWRVEVTCVAQYGVACCGASRTSRLLELLR